jgi:dipeptidyl aminopeptidase/acylaminoacyl peptidase
MLMLGESHSIKKFFIAPSGKTSVLNRMTVSIIFSSILIFLFISMGCQRIKKEKPPEATQNNPTEENVTAITAPNSLPKSTSTQLSKTTAASPVMDSWLQLTYVSAEPTEKPDSPGFNGVYTVNVDCLEKDELCLGEPILLFHRTTRIDEIEWSPDGKKVAYGTQGNIIIADPDGTNEIHIPQLELGSNSIHPHWSPDGKMLAYISGAEHSPIQVLVYNLDTGQSTRVVKSVINPMQYYWISKDQVAYISNVSKDEIMAYQITFALVDGTIIKKLPEGDKGILGLFDLTFSPDHRELLFSGDTRDPFDKTHLFYNKIENDLILDLPINNRTFNNFSPAWSPTGDWIAFVINYEMPEIYLMKPDGTHLRLVTHNLFSNISPAWRIIR